MMNSIQYYLDIFEVTHQQLRKVAETALSRGGDYCDFYFENTTFFNLLLNAFLGKRWVSYTFIGIHTHQTNAQILIKQHRCSAVSEIKGLAEGRDNHHRILQALGFIIHPGKVSAEYFLTRHGLTKEGIVQ